MSRAVIRPWTKRLAGVAFAAASCLAAGEAGAQSTAPAGAPVAPPNPQGSVTAPEDPVADQVKVDPLAWDPRWGRFSTGEYVATGVFALISLVTLGFPPFENTWSGTNSFDTGVRNTFRLQDVTDRARARDASDLLLTVMLNQLMVDTLVVTWWGHGKGSTAWQMTMIDIEALALNGSINGLLNVIAGRERPYAAECVGPTETQNRDCTGSKRYRSYFSGHTSTSFAIAGLLCQHHAHLPIYGGGIEEPILTCISGFAAASAVGTFRVIADQHFATDALTGAAVGSFTGLLVPWVLHYGRGSSPSLKPTAHSSMTLVPAPLGAALIGEF
jgi:membrane-associated phospholipid phosphatase